MKKLLPYTATAALLMLSACSLDEDNPTGFTNADLLTSVEGYETLVNNCYFAMQRYFYGTNNWMALTEGDTDLWTFQANDDNQSTEYFWFYGGASPNTSYTTPWWNGTYDGIGACNIAIDGADQVPFASQEARNAKVAEARFLRAVYYFNAVEQFGAVTLLAHPQEKINYSPLRTTPAEIYRTLILPDLEFAAQWLPVGTDATCSVPTRKSALGFLAKAYLQLHEYGVDYYIPQALKVAKDLIADCESGGARYNTYMYPTYDAVFAESNNWENREALWKHRWYAGTDNHGSSNGNQYLNRNDEYFLCDLSKFGARVDDEASRLTWEGSMPGIFMPTQHLLSLFVQDDGSLDPRFHASFTTQWTANVAYIWDASSAKLYGKEEAVVGTSLAVGDPAIRFVLPQDADYEQVRAGQSTSTSLDVLYEDVYQDHTHTILMDRRGLDNGFRYFYPSLNKHNSSRYYVADASKRRNGNLNATFMMRMAEVYLIAAEAAIYQGQGGDAMYYINKVRSRAGARLLQGDATLNTVLDERARELCGEYCRFYDLKRTGMLKDASYLLATHPDLGIYFEPEYAVRPIPSSFLSAIDNGEAYQNVGY